MSDVISAQHPPAMKVGGRRLSVTSRPKPHVSSGSPPASPTTLPEETDYPRPAAPGDEHHHVPPPNEEEAPKKKKHGHGNHDEKRLKESAFQKAEAARPTRDNNAPKGAFGAAGRIAQPAGKTFGV
ncbi:hypothetical protein BV22DRAFT_1194051 [Leucogyrophana mollusca]|uniref:Uncharacterized protein n=1 Tax=Leucogyrophana mollusca TaxID=85980 RepID=A0ACB8BM55_9AGAM|nr:hypothetical protein BV22DRAFT_1194051 [Leucogyrophana mollusca]